jgi:isocitrate/isopropylmalate dehydrogenase
LRSHWFDKYAVLTAKKFWLEPAAELAHNYPTVYNNHKIFVVDHTCP